MTIHVRVEQVNIPAWSTIGYGFGHDDMGRGITFVGDHRPMAALGMLVQAERGYEIELDTTFVIDIEDVTNGPARSRTVQ